MKRRAPAKVNMCLEVVRRFPSGFHAIRTVMVKLPRLYDGIEVLKNDTKAGVAVQSSGIPIPRGKDNICRQAAEAFLSAVREKDTGISIRITKRIPVAAGLGGGSSDAATTLMCLNELFHYPMTGKQLTRIAARLGKDVPFFLIPKRAAYMEGMGDNMIGSVDIPSLYVLVVNPGVRVLAADAYRGLDNELWYMNRQTRTNNSSRMFDMLQKKDVRGAAGMLYNDFELWAEKNYPIIKDIKQAMMAFGASGALMSGSGSTVFGIFPSAPILRRAKQVCTRRYPEFFVAEG